MSLERQALAGMRWPRNSTVVKGERPMRFLIIGCGSIGTCRTRCLRHLGFDRVAAMGKQGTYFNPSTLGLAGLP